MATSRQRTLSDKETLFCEYYLICRSARDAAARAGYRLFPERTGMRLLREKRIRTKIAALRRSEDRSEAAAGLSRIAFGSTSDAVRLLYAEDPPTPQELERMDLFSVAEIRRTKGGGMEIKFFDRIKALEKLSELSASAEGECGMNEFVSAIQRGADLIREEEE